MDLYGLTTSLKEWTQFRNQSLGGFNWYHDERQPEAQKSNHQDIWKIVEVVNAPDQRCRFARGEEVGCAAASGVPVQRCRSPRGATGGRTFGLFVAYVDDVLAVGEWHVLEGFCTREWEVGELDWVTPGSPPVRFLGMEIEFKDQKYRIHQRACMQNVFNLPTGD